MFSLQSIIVLALCLIKMLHSSNDANMRHMMKRNQNNDGANSFEPGRGNYRLSKRLHWRVPFNNSNQTGVQYGNVSFTCDVSGIPAAYIHWLKNGKRIDQSGTCQSIDADDVDLNANSSMRQSSYITLSKLYIDCLDETDEANYTCVAQTETHRITNSTFLTVVPSENPPEQILKACAAKGRPARIYMVTFSLVELKINSVRLFCRAHGNPAPTITWYDNNNETIQDGGMYSISANGDLIIKDVSWNHTVCRYRCEAHNMYGTDTISPWLFTPWSD